MLLTGGSHKSAGAAVGSRQRPRRRWAERWPKQERRGKRDGPGEVIVGQGFLFFLFFFLFSILDFRFELLPKFQNPIFEFKFMLGISHSNQVHK
jgi:hypothetical protein